MTFHNELLLVETRHFKTVGFKKAVSNMLIGCNIVVVVFALVSYFQLFRAYFGKFTDYSSFVVNENSLEAGGTFCKRP